MRLIHKQIKTNNIFDLHDIDLNDIKPIKTDFDLISEKINFSTKNFRFKTKSNISYDLDLIKTPINTNLKISNGLILNQILDDNKIKNKQYAYDIGFTLTERNVNNKYISYTKYYENTNKFEAYEVFSKVAYILYEIKDDEIEIFTIGKNIGLVKEKIMLLCYKNMFSTEYLIFEGGSDYFAEGAYYFIKNKIK